VEPRSLPSFPTRRSSDLFRLFGGEKTIVKAVNDVSLDIYEGETLGLVGESGCGKTTVGRTILQLEKATGGTIRYRDRDLAQLSRSEEHTSELQSRENLVC